MMKYEKVVKDFTQNFPESSGKKGFEEDEKIPKVL